MRVIDRLKAIKKIGTEIEVPHEVWTLFGPNTKNIRIVGDEICLGEDYASLEKAQAAMDWYVNQFGGNITWK